MPSPLKQLGFKAPQIFISFLLPSKGRVPSMSVKLCFQEIMTALRNASSHTLMLWMVKGGHLFHNHSAQKRGNCCAQVGKLFASWATGKSLSREAIHNGKKNNRTSKSFVCLFRRPMLQSWVWIIEYPYFMHFWVVDSKPVSAMKGKMEWMKGVSYWNHQNMRKSQIVLMLQFE